MTHASPIIETTGLQKQFGDRVAVAGVDLRVPRGSAFGFLGHNGAGKTTVIRMLLGLTRPSAGRIEMLGGELPPDRGRVLERVGAIVEEPHFHPHLTGRENLEVVAAVRGNHARAQIAPALERVGLSDRAGDRVRTYSQGMRQRLGIARCLLADPELLILDEPLNGLDPGGILEMRTLLAGLVGEGRTIFLSSHLLDEVEKTCDSAAVIDRGRIIASGPIGSLLDAGPPQLDIGLDDPAAGAELLRRRPEVLAVDRHDGGLRIKLDGAGRAAAVNAALVHGGIAVHRLIPVRESLEHRFLEMTSRLGGDA